ncbi:hypothetical protein SpCBS45565_g04436 [Spizellomyces sp. 'palustris']|nr:hypothetical protein SpCBS45565_g04436 [Spizellomyces sp. 'palustris']
MMDAKFRMKHSNALAQCMLACEECANRAVEENMDCYGHCKACAELCNVTMRLMSVNSMHAGETAAICAKACDHCAEMCAKHKTDHCQTCAQSCREASGACRDIQAAYEKMGKK